MIARVTALPEPSVDEFDLTTVLAALADEVRLAIVRALASGGEQACGTFELGVSKATRSHHLRVLRESGLTHTRIDGTRRLVTLRRSDLDERFPGLLDAVLTTAAVH